MKNRTFYICIAVVVVVIISCLIGAMYLCGYTFASWFEKYWAWAVIIGAALVLFIVTVIFFKIRKN